MVRFFERLLDNVNDYFVNQVLAKLGIKGILGAGAITLIIVSSLLANRRGLRFRFIVLAFIGLFVSDMLLIVIFGPLANLMRFPTAFILGLVTARKSSRQFINAFVPLGANLLFDYLTSGPSMVDAGVTFAGLWGRYLIGLLLMTLASWIGFKVASHKRATPPGDETLAPSA